MLFSDSDDDEPIMQRRERNFKKRINFGPDDFRQRFRLSRTQADMLINSIGDLLGSHTRRNHALSPEQKILTALRFLATGGFYKLNGDAHGVSDSTICRSVRSVVEAINQRLFDELIRWPRDNAARNAIAQGFFGIAGMPLVAGCIDGTLIRIKAPSENEDQFVDRHGDHSLNCMVVCGPKYEAFYISSRWPGRLNDKRVLSNSDLYGAFEAGWRPFPNGILLGDSGYTLKQWLLTPIGGNVQNPLEEEFNRRHRSTRRVIERFFGHLKQRFGCLNIPLRVSDPSYAGEIFKACCVLQNIIALDNNEPREVDNLNDYIPENQDLDANGQQIAPRDPRLNIMNMLN